jgi:hypothetical protein
MSKLRSDKPEKLWITIEHSKTINRGVLLLLLLLLLLLYGVLTWHTSENILIWTITPFLGIESRWEKEICRSRSRQSTRLAAQIWAYFRVSVESCSDPLCGCVRLYHLTATYLEIISLQMKFWVATERRSISIQTKCTFLPYSHLLSSHSIFVLWSQNVTTGGRMMYYALLV